MAGVALPLGEARIQEIANEEPLLKAMQASLGNANGLYMFPRMEGREQSNAMRLHEQKLASNPSGILVYHPQGTALKFPRKLAVEFLEELAAVMIAAFLLAMSRVESFAARVAFVAAAGVIAAISSTVSHWNWYGFPATYSLSLITMDVVGFALAGIVMAAWLNKTTAAA